MKTLWALTLLLFVSLAFADTPSLPTGELLREFPWRLGDTRIPVDIHSPAPFTFFTPGPEAKIGWEQTADAPGTYALQVAYSGKVPYQFQLLSLERAMIAPIVTKQYAMVGEVKYENVPAGSYLEMWSSFASTGPGYPPRSYFSRTLAEQGPMGQLRGTSDWRTFWLPFDATGANSELQSLVVNLRLNGPGVVHVRGLKLFQYPDASSAASAAPQKPLEVILSVTQPDGMPVQISLDGVPHRDDLTLAQALKARLQANPQANFIVRGAHTVPYAAIEGVLQMLRGAGAQNIYFASEGSLSHKSGREIHWASFVGGIAAALLAMAAFSRVGYFLRRWRGRAKERELRRIASLDG